MASGEDSGLEVRGETRKRKRRGRKFWKPGRKRTALIVGSVLLTLAAGYGLLARRAGHRAAIPPAIILPKLPPTPPGIVIHHSYTPGTIHGHHVGVAKLSEIQARTNPTWGYIYEGKKYYIDYHYIIRTDGVVEHGRPDLCPGAHARTFNNWLGVCLVGDFATNTRFRFKPDHPTPAQLDSLISLCESLMAKYHIPPQMIKRHRDVNVTWCPGDNFPYAAVMKKLTAFAAAHPEMYPTPPVILKIVKPPPRKK